MASTGSEHSGLPRAFRALLTANARYWPSILPIVHRHLKYWEVRAALIPDPALRACAVEKLRGERFNCEVAATLAVLAARHLRPEVVVATVALQVMYDYLDGVTERPHPDPLRNSSQLYGAFAAALQPAEEPARDWYRHLPGDGDGGYLAELAAVCRESLWRLPAAGVVLPAALEAAHRCGEAQGRVHAIPRLGTDQLAAWAAAGADGTGLAWWEYAAGAAASVLSIHALISAAADPRTTAEEAKAIDAAYLAACALSTLLDSLVDQHRDVADHRFIAYYPSAQRAIERMTAVAGQAATAVADLRHRSHHAMTVAGVAAFYLSAPEASDGPARAVTEALVAELRPLITPILTLFRVWRRSKRPARPSLAI